MSMGPHSDAGRETLAYYDRHSDRFLRETLGVDMTPLHEPFLALLPAGGRILDAGCGSGRDALAFASRGYAVTAIDGAPAMVAAARAMGIAALHLGFEDIAFEGEFDGVWACASLLHVPKSRIVGVLRRLGGALMCGGHFYMSFKEGSGEEVRGGRLFNDYTEGSLRELLLQLPELVPSRIWETGDRRPGREGETWINAIARRIVPSQSTATPVAPGTGPS